MIVYSKRIYTENTCKSGYLEIENSKIKRFYSDKEYKLIPDINYGNNRIIPGIFDTHNHGGFGVRLDLATQDEIKLYLKGLASVGVTEVFATTFETEAMKEIAKAKEQNYEGAKIMGIHSEGPWGSRVGEKGINTGYPSVDLDYAKCMVESCNGLLKLVDIAPEIDNAKEAIDYFISNGINVGMYHTNANYEEANRGVDWGISVATHLSNVMTGLHHRDVGTLGCGLLRDEVNCELICDGLHVSLPMIKIILKIKNHAQIMMVSDNVQYCGAPEGRYRGVNVKEGSDRSYINVTKEGFVLSDTGRLSGSSKPIIYGIKNLVEKLGMPLEEVVPMFSLNQNIKYGFSDNKGSINVNKDADFVVIDDNYDVINTFVEGKIVYDRDVDGVIFNQAYIDKYRIE